MHTGKCCIKLPQLTRNNGKLTSRGPRESSGTHNMQRLPERGRTNSMSKKVRNMKILHKNLHFFKGEKISNRKNTINRFPRGISRTECQIEIIPYPTVKKENR